MIRLEPSFRAKVWGANSLGPWFGDSAEKIGEVWFTHTPPLPLLVKFIFTTGKLPVQVHPDDDYAARHGLGSGKNEMWHVLRAEPGAAVANYFVTDLVEARLAPPGREPTIVRTQVAARLLRTSVPAADPQPR